MIHWYSPGGASIHPTTSSFGPMHTNPNPKRRLDWFSRFCTSHGRVAILYNGPPLPLKLLLPVGIWTPRTWFFGPTEVLHRRHLDRFSRFAGLTTVTNGRPTNRQIDRQTNWQTERETDRKTDRPLYSVCNDIGRIYVGRPSTRCSLIKAKFHYASLSGAGSELAPNRFGDSSELAPSRIGAF